MLADWCKKNRCIPDGSARSGYQENPDGAVKFNPGNDPQGNLLTISQFIDQHEAWRSPLGGPQGGQGQMELLGIKSNFDKGSFWGKLAEAYAGTHDKLNSVIWCENLGDAKNLGGSIIGKI